MRACLHDQVVRTGLPKCLNGLTTQRWQNGDPLMTREANNLNSLTIEDYLPAFVP